MELKIITNLHLTIKTGHVNFAGILDPHTVVAILKAYLRELPEPLLTFKAYNKLYALHRKFKKFLVTNCRLFYHVQFRTNLLQCECHFVCFS